MPISGRRNGRRWAAGRWSAALGVRAERRNSSPIFWSNVASFSRTGAASGRSSRTRRKRTAASRSFPLPSRRRAWRKRASLRTSGLGSRASSSRIRSPCAGIAAPDLWPSAPPCRASGLAVALNFPCFRRRGGGRRWNYGRGKCGNGAEDDCIAPAHITASFRPRFRTSLRAGRMTPGTEVAGRAYVPSAPAHWDR